MPQLNLLKPLDFDYERFPGVALRATDHALPGHALTDRPKQVVELIKRIATLTGHILGLIGNPFLCTPANAAEVQDELEALTDAVNVLQPLQALDVESVSELEVRNLARSGGAVFAGLLNLLLLLMDKWKSPTSLEWYKNLFREPEIPPPQALLDFLHPSKDRNQIFASWWVQGNNPLCVSGVALPDIVHAVGKLDASMYARVMPGDTLAAANAEERLFWVDFPTLLAGLEVGDFPVSKRLSRPIVLFAVKKDERGQAVVDEPFVPLAIFDESTDPKLVWSNAASPTTANAWTRAMLASLCANQLHHTFRSHFPRTHFVMEAVAVATLRELETPKHPLYWLLRTHIDGTLGFNETALDSFMTQSGADRFLMASSLRTGQKLMRESLDGWKHFDFPDDIKQRKVDAARLPYYPYRDDAQLWWNAIETLVRDVVDAAYTNDPEVRNDEQLQDWALVLVAKRTTVDNGAELIAAAPTTKAELRALLQKIIFTCTAYHAAVQIPLNGFDVSPLTAPCSLYPDDSTDPPESMLASLGTSLFQLAFFYFGDIITEPVGTYTVNRAEIPQNMRAPVDKFRSVLPKIAHLIGEANDKKRKVGAYKTLLPEKVSRSVDI